jgi:hypothetical protein
MQRSQFLNTKMHKLPVFFWVITIGVIILVSVPYVWAAGFWRGDYIFGGFLFNPIDSNSYLAKMRLGWEGSWQFVLPYTAEPGESTYLFLYYLFLGHLARVSHLNLICTFHLARLVGAFLMLLSMWRFFAVLLQDSWLVKVAFALAALGSGMGWLASIFGAFTADMWVAEAYPFLSAYANPHFTLALAIIMWVLTPIDEQSWPQSNLIKALITLLAGVVLGIVLPFGVMVVGIVLAGLGLWQIFDGVPILKSPFIMRLALISAGASLFIIYDYWIISTVPGMQDWNAQNLTPSPSLFIFVISFLPAIIFGIPGTISLLQSKNERYRVLLIWCLSGIVLLYLPFGLQRRLMIGLMIPFAGLSALGIQYLTRSSFRRQFVLIVLLYLLAVPTNLVVLLTGVHGVLIHDSLLYLTKAESRGLGWLVEHAPENALVLASPQTGLFIPAYSGQRVLYGHPFETRQAEKMRSLISRLLDGSADSQEQAYVNNIDYIFYGPREMEFGEPEFLMNFDTVFQEENVFIFQKRE